MLYTSTAGKASRVSIFLNHCVCASCQAYLLTCICVCMHVTSACVLKVAPYLHTCMHSNPFARRASCLVSRVSASYLEYPPRISSICRHTRHTCRHTLIPTYISTCRHTHTRIHTVTCAINNHTHKYALQTCVDESYELS